MWPSCTRRWRSWKRKWKLRQRHLYVLRTLHLVWKGKKSCNTYQLSYVSDALYLCKIKAAAEASLAAAHTAFGMKRTKINEPWFFSIHSWETAAATHMIMSGSFGLYSWNMLKTKDPTHVNEVNLFLIMFVRNESCDICECVDFCLVFPCIYENSWNMLKTKDSIPVNEAYLFLLYLWELKAATYMNGLTLVSFPPFFMKRKKPQHV